MPVKCITTRGIQVIWSVELNRDRTSLKNAQRNS